jgi:hypothetical protein
VFSFIEAPEATFFMHIQHTDFQRSAAILMKSTFTLLLYLLALLLDFGCTSISSRQSFDWRQHSVKVIDGYISQPGKEELASLTRQFLDEPDINLTVGQTRCLFP